MKALWSVAFLMLVACGGATTVGDELTEEIAQPRGPRYLQYAPESSVGYVHADFIRLDQSPHADRLRDLFSSLSSQDEAAYSLLGLLDRGFIVAVMSNYGQAAAPLVSEIRDVIARVPAA